eukprot:scaffold1659_cov371-Prasinococcus_capsulatus_cf.AAC.12
MSKRRGRNQWRASIEDLISHTDTPLAEGPPLDPAPWRPARRRIILRGCAARRAEGAAARRAGMRERCAPAADKRFPRAGTQQRG